MKITSLSNEIFLSREAIRSQIIQEVQNYLDIADVELSKSSFLSYIINILSTLTANILFYQISVYKEFFLTKAQLNNSVINGAASIGYMPDDASYAKLDILLTFPFRFDTPKIEFVFPKFTAFKIDTIRYVIDYNLKFVVIANSIVKCYKYNDTSNEEVFPYIDNEQNTFSLLINTKQIDEIHFEFSVVDTGMEYQFTEYSMNFNGQLADINVVVEEPNSGIKYQYERFSSIYLMTSEDCGFVSRKTDTGHDILFGNGLIGKQPQPGSIIRITVYTTLGANGNVIKGKIADLPRINGITDDGRYEKVTYSASNPSIAIGGKNEPSLEEIKYLAIDNLTALHRLVSENDYNRIGSLLPDSPIAENSYPILKRSDIRTNEIQLFTLLFYDDIRQYRIYHTI